MATRNALLALCLMPYLASALLVQPKALQLHAVRPAYSRPLLPVPKEWMRVSQRAWADNPHFKDEEDSNAKECVMGARQSAG